MSASFNDAELRDLLLHRLAEPRALELEERLMTDPDLAAQLDDATYDLLDDYAAGCLSAAERASVEEHLLVRAENRMHLAVARALKRLDAPTAAPRHASAAAARRRAAGALRARRGPWRVAAALPLAASLIAVALLVALPRLHQASVTPVPTLTLLADTSRGASARTLRLAASAREVRVQAEVTEGGAPAYRLSVLDEHGQVLFNADRLPTQHAGPYAYVESDIPAGALAPGAHLVRIEPRGGGADAAAYTWEVHGLIER